MSCKNYDDSSQCQLCRDLDGDPAGSVECYAEEAPAMFDATDGTHERTATHILALEHALARSEHDGALCYVRIKDCESENARLRLEVAELRSERQREHDLRCRISGELETISALIPRDEARIERVALWLWELEFDNQPQLRWKNLPSECREDYRRRARDVLDVANEG